MTSIEKIQDNLTRLTIEKNSIIQTFVQRISLQQSQLQNLCFQLKYIEDQYVKTSIRTIEEMNYLRKFEEKKYIILDITNLQEDQDYLFPKGAQFIKYLGEEKQKQEQVRKIKQSCEELYRQFYSLKEETIELKQKIQELQAQKSAKELHVESHQKQRQSVQYLDKKTETSKIQEFRSNLEPLSVQNSPKKLRQQNFQFAKINSPNKQQIKSQQVLSKDQKSSLENNVDKIEKQKQKQGKQRSRQRQKQKKDDENKVEWQKLFQSSEGKEIKVSPKKKTKSKIIYIRK